VQETLVAAYGKLADKHAGIENVKSYLFKMAANQWITWCRRKKIHIEYTQTITEPIYKDDMYVVQDSLSTLLNYLPPKERVAFVLSEVFESKNEEIAAILGNTEGAVKSALVRAREKVKCMNIIPIKNNEAVENSEHRKILNLAVEAFNRRDIDAFAKLFAVNAIGNAPGCFFETSAEEIKKGSLFYTINNHDDSPQPESMRAEIFTFNGETLFALFDGDTLDDIWKLTIEDGEILRFDCYYCCPDVLAEIAESLNKIANSHGYWFEQKLVKS
jgi:RNA polymerase sigma-70 factor (ECF subfamily)